MDELLTIKPKNWCIRRIVEAIASTAHTGKDRMAAKPKVAKTAPAPLGASPWAYRVTAFVGAATLLWAIVSHFIPKPA